MSVVSKNKNTKQANSEIKNICLRLFAILIINMLSVLLMCLYFYVADKNIYEGYPLILIAFGATDFITSYYIGRKLKKNGLICGIAYNLPLSSLCIIISLILNDFTFDIRIVYFLTVRILLSAIGGITAVNSKSKRR